MKNQDLKRYSVLLQIKQKGKDLKLKLNSGMILYKANGF